MSSWNSLERFRVPLAIFLFLTMLFALATSTFAEINLQFSAGIDAAGINKKDLQYDKIINLENDYKPEEIYGLFCKDHIKIKETGPKEPTGAFISYLDSTKEEEKREIWNLDFPIISFGENGCFQKIPLDKIEINYHVNENKRILRVGKEKSSSLNIQFRGVQSFWSSKNRTKTDADGVRIPRDAFLFNENYEGFQKSVYGQLLKLYRKTGNIEHKQNALDLKDLFFDDLVFFVEEETKKILNLFLEQNLVYQKTKKTKRHLSSFFSDFLSEKVGLPLETGSNNDSLFALDWFTNLNSLLWRGGEQDQEELNAWKELMLKKNYEYIKNEAKTFQEKNRNFYNWNFFGQKQLHEAKKNQYSGEINNLFEQGQTNTNNYLLLKEKFALKLNEIESKNDVNGFLAWFFEWINGFDFKTEYSCLTIKQKVILSSINLIETKIKLFESQFSKIYSQIEKLEAKIATWSTHFSQRQQNSNNFNPQKISINSEKNVQLAELKSNLKNLNEEYLRLNPWLGKSIEKQIEIISLHILIKKIHQADTDGNKSTFNSLNLFIEKINKIYKWEETIKAKQKMVGENVYLESLEEIFEPENPGPNEQIKTKNISLFAEMDLIEELTEYENLSMEEIEEKGKKIIEKLNKLNWIKNIFLEQNKALYQWLKNEKWSWEDLNEPNVPVIPVNEDSEKQKWKNFFRTNLKKVGYINSSKTKMSTYMELTTQTQTQRKNNEFTDIVDSMNFFAVSIKKETTNSKDKYYITLWNKLKKGLINYHEPIEVDYDETTKTVTWKSSVEDTKIKVAWGASYADFWRTIKKNNHIFLYNNLFKNPNIFDTDEANKLFEQIAIRSDFDFWEDMFFEWFFLKELPNKITIEDPKKWKKEDFDDQEIFDGANYSFLDVLNWLTNKNFVDHIDTVKKQEQIFDLIFYFQNKTIFTLNKIQKNNANFFSRLPIHFYKSFFANEWKTNIEQKYSEVVFETKENFLTAIQQNLKINGSVASEQNFQTWFNNLKNSAVSKDDKNNYYNKNLAWINQIIFYWTKLYNQNLLQKSSRIWEKLFKTLDFINFNIKNKKIADTGAKVQISALSKNLNKFNFHSILSKEIRCNFEEDEEGKNFCINEDGLEISVAKIQNLDGILKNWIRQNAEKIAKEIWIQNILIRSFVSLDKSLDFFEQSVLNEWLRKVYDETIEVLVPGTDSSNLDLKKKEKFLWDKIMAEIGSKARESAIKKLNNWNEDKYDLMWIFDYIKTWDKGWWWQFAKFKKLWEKLENFENEGFDPTNFEIDSFEPWAGENFEWILKRVFDNDEIIKKTSKSYDVKPKYEDVINNSINSIQAELIPIFNPKIENAIFTPFVAKEKGNWINSLHFFDIKKKVLKLQRLKSKWLNPNYENTDLKNDDRTNPVAFFNLNSKNELIKIDTTNWKNPDWEKYWVIEEKKKYLDYENIEENVQVFSGNFMNLYLSGEKENIEDVNYSNFLFFRLNDGKIIGVNKSLPRTLLYGERYLFIRFMEQHLREARPKIYFQSHELGYFLGSDVPFEKINTIYKAFATLSGIKIVGSELNLVNSLSYKGETKLLITQTEDLEMQLYPGGSLIKLWNEVIVDANYARNNNINVGDEITLIGIENIVVVGIATLKNFVFPGINPLSILNSKTNGLIVVSPFFSSAMQSTTHHSLSPIWALTKKHFFLKLPGVKAGQKKEENEFASVRELKAEANRKEKRLKELEEQERKREEEETRQGAVSSPAVPGAGTPTTPANTPDSNLPASDEIVPGSARNTTSDFLWKKYEDRKEDEEEEEKVEPASAPKRKVLDQFLSSIGEAAIGSKKFKIKNFASEVFPPYEINKQLINLIWVFLNWTIIILTTLITLTWFFSLLNLIRRKLEENKKTLGILKAHGARKIDIFLENLALPGIMLLAVTVGWILSVFLQIPIFFAIEEKTSLVFRIFNFNFLLFFVIAGFVFFCYFVFVWIFQKRNINKIPILQLIKAKVVQKNNGYFGGKIKNYSVRILPFAHYPMMKINYLFLLEIWKKLIILVFVIVFFILNFMCTFFLYTTPQETIRKQYENINYKWHVKYNESDPNNFFSWMKPYNSAGFEPIEDGLPGLPEYYPIQDEVLDMWTKKTGTNDEEVYEKLESNSILELLAMLDALHYKAINIKYLKEKIGGFSDEGEATLCGLILNWLSIQNIDPETCLDELIKKIMPFSYSDEVKSRFPIGGNLIDIDRTGGEEVVSQIDIFINQQKVVMKGLEKETKAYNLDPELWKKVGKQEQERVINVIVSQKFADTFPDLKIGSTFQAVSPLKTLYFKVYPIKLSDWTYLKPGTEVKEEQQLGIPITDIETNSHFFYSSSIEKLLKGKIRFDQTGQAWIKKASAGGETSTESGLSGDDFTSNGEYERGELVSKRKNEYLPMIDLERIQLRYLEQGVEKFVFPFKKESKYGKQQVLDGFNNWWKWNLLKGNLTKDIDINRFDLQIVENEGEEEEKIFKTFRIIDVLDSYEDNEVYTLIDDVNAMIGFPNKSVHRPNKEIPYFFNGKLSYADIPEKVFFNLALTHNLGFLDFETISAGGKGFAVQGIQAIDEEKNLYTNFLNFMTRLANIGLIMNLIASMFFLIFIMKNGFEFLRQKSIYLRVIGYRKKELAKQSLLLFGSTILVALIGGTIIMTVLLQQFEEQITGNFQLYIFFVENFFVYLMPFALILLVFGAIFWGYCRSFDKKDLAAKVRSED